MKKEEIQHTQHSIVLYQNDDSNVCVSVYYNNEAFWMTQKVMAELFGCSTDNISLLLKKIFSEGELDKNSVTEKNSATASDGKEQTDIFLSTNRRNILADKGTISHDQAIDKANKEYEIFRVRQDREYISDFDRETEKYLSHT